MIDWMQEQCICCSLTAGMGPLLLHGITVSLQQCSRSDDALMMVQPV